ncbi:hypothetical protein NUACC21_37000 [Scytonema sp. NUACC21]
MYNFQRRKLLFSYAVIPLFITTTSISSDYPALDFQGSQLAVRKDLTTWIGSFWQRRPRHRLGARSGVCPIAPGLLETYVVWHERPLFIWHGEGTQISVRDRETQTVLWTQALKGSDRQMSYNGKEPLQPGKLYQWQLLGTKTSSSDRNNWTTFQIMPATEREKIATDLQTLEQKLGASKASKEEIALKKADYFLNYNIKQEVAQNNEAPNAWSDALQTLFEIENPSSSFIKERQGYVVGLCTEQTTVSTAKTLTSNS